MNGVEHNTFITKIKDPHIVDPSTSSLSVSLDDAYRAKMHKANCLHSCIGWK